MVVEDSEELSTPSPSFSHVTNFSRPKEDEGPPSPKLPAGNLFPDLPPPPVVPTQFNFAK